MKKKVFIHMGMQKTATTFLQESYFPHLPGVTFISRPYTQENHAFNKLQYLDESLYDPSEFEAEMDRIYDRSRHDRILISDELFNGYASYNFINRGLIAQRLQAAIPEAEVILFIRNQFDLVQSLYNQYVKKGWFGHPLRQKFVNKPGGSFSLESWLRGHRQWNPNNRFINHRALFSIEHLRFSSMVAFYKSLFHQVHVFLYEDFEADPTGSLHRLHALLDLPSDSTPQQVVDKKGKKNQSLADRHLRNQLVRNQIKHIETQEGLIFKWSAKVLTRDLQRNYHNLPQRNQHYLEELLAAADIYADNRLADETWTLGMQQHAAKYFGTPD